MAEMVHSSPGTDFGSSEAPRDHSAPPLLLQYWRVVLRWKWVILGIIAASLIAGLVWTMIQTPEYTARARLEIRREQANVTNVQSLEGEDAGRNVEFYQTQYALLASRNMAIRVANSLRLPSDPAFFAAHGMEPPFTVVDGRARRLTEQELRAARNQVVRQLLANLAVRPVRGSALVDVAYTSYSPAMSQKVANAWANEYIIGSIDRRFESTADARQYLEGRLADLRVRLEESERNVVAYANANNIVELEKSEGTDGKSRTSRTLVADDLQALNSALAEAKADRIGAEARLRSAGSSAQMVNNSTIGSLRQRRAEAAAEYARMMVQFEPGYPQARAVQQQIQSLDRAIAAEEGRVTGSTRADFDQAVSREQQLQAQVNGLSQAISGEREASIQFNIYQREADTNRQLYEALLQRYKEIGVAGVGVSNVAIVDDAQAPNNPSAPSLPTNLALALLFGTLGAAVAVFALEQIDEGVKDPSQVRRQLGLPLLGSVPDIIDHDIAELLRDPKSVASEAYFTIRSNLGFATDHGFPRSLLVTSTREAEGKSTAALGIATVLGRSGSRVLLIDADMRSPSAHGMIGMTNEEGLSNYLAGGNNLERMIRETPIRNVSLLSAGPTPPSAAELLASSRIVDLIKAMEDKFDHVIVDTAPLLGLADAPMVLRAVEGSAYVVEAGGVAARGIRASLDRLRSARRPVFGIILSRLTAANASYGYGYGYSYGYGDRDNVST